MIYFLKENRWTRIKRRSVNLLKKYASFYLTKQLAYELFIFALSITALIYFHDKQTSPYWIALAILSAIALSIILNIFKIIDDLRKFGYLQGAFKRIRFFEYKEHRPDQPANTLPLPDRPYIWRAYDYINIDSYVFFKYLGAGSFSGEIEYPGGMADFEISLDPSNPRIGRGGYNYTTIDNRPRSADELDYGNYSLFKYSLRRDYVLLHYKNIVPTNKSAGYEMLLSREIYYDLLSKLKHAILKKKVLRIRVADNQKNISGDNDIIFCPIYFGIIDSTKQEIVAGHRKNNLQANEGSFTAYPVAFISTIIITNETFSPDDNRDEPGAAMIYRRLFP